jgi:hypothetical protein
MDSCELWDVFTELPHLDLQKKERGEESPGIFAFLFTQGQLDLYFIFIHLCAES